MSFRPNTYQQISLHDRLNNLTDRERRMLKKSWAEPFATQIFPLIDESKFAVLYCNDNDENNNGRPGAPVNVVVGSLLLKDMVRLSDEELLESILFDTRFQHALHLTSCDEIPYSDRTPSRFRERLYKHELETGEDLLKEEIERLGKEYVKLLKIHSGVKRMDSLMVSSSCKNMGRLELICTCVSSLVKAVIQLGEAAMLPARLLRYAEGSNKNAVCYRMKNDEVTARLEDVTTDALCICELCGKGYADFKEYQLLSRMVVDQTRDGQLKPNKEISPQSLQNPSDEDATFRRKAGEQHQGYTANVVETCGKNGNIITNYEYEVNQHSDAEFGAEVIKELGPQEEKLVLIGDGAFASEENFKAAAANNIELVTTNLTGEKPPEIILDFVIEDQEIKSCPAGHAPIDCKYKPDKDEYRAHFDKPTCEGCPHRNECPVIMQKRSALVKLSHTTIDRAEYAEKLSTDEYKAHARTRNGVEGVPSVLRRRYGVDDMPVRGLLRSKLWFGFKIGAINVKRVIAAALDTALLCLIRKYTWQNHPF